MIDILRDLLEVADTLMKFLVFLGPNFKAVTDNSAGIDNLVAEKEEEHLTYPEYKSYWNISLN